MYAGKTLPLHFRNDAFSYRFSQSVMHYISHHVSHFLRPFPFHFSTFLFLLFSFGCGIIMFGTFRSQFTLKLNTMFWREIAWDRMRRTDKHWNKQHTALTRKRIFWSTTNSLFSIIYLRINTWLFSFVLVEMLFEVGLQMNRILVVPSMLHACFFFSF